MCQDTHNWQECNWDNASLLLWAISRFRVKSRFITNLIVLTGLHFSAETWDSGGVTDHSQWQFSNCKQFK